MISKWFSLFPKSLQIIFEKSHFPISLEKIIFCKVNKTFEPARAHWFGAFKTLDINDVLLHTVPANLETILVECSLAAFRSVLSGRESNVAHIKRLAGHQGHLCMSKRPRCSDGQRPTQSRVESRGSRMEELPEMASRRMGWYGGAAMLGNKFRLHNL